MRKAAALIVLLLNIAAFGIEAIPGRVKLGEEGAETFVATSGRLSVRLSRETGCPIAYAIDGQTILVADDEFRTPVVWGRWDPQNAGPLPVSDVTVNLLDGQTIRSCLTCDGWRVVQCLQLYPDQLAVRRWLSFEPANGERRKFSLMASFSLGKLQCPKGKGRYFVPGMFPPKVYGRDSWQAGRTREGAWNDISPIVADSGAGWGVAALLDILRDYSDRGRVLIHERDDGLAFTCRFEGEGWCQSGVPQMQGDAWLVFRQGTAENALAALQDWHSWCGHDIPEGRPERVRSRIIYSTHPKGKGEYGMRDSDGFQGLFKCLPMLKALGANTIWLRPVEDRAMYDPGDLYRLQNGIGTSDDHLAFVREAHKFGFEVWRDAVMHGGSTDNERTKIHPEWVCRREDGAFADTYWAYDYNWPSWISYFADYVSWSTHRYELDGWRLDVPTGSRFPNWNPEIPYARASYSQLQGGIHQLRSIRKAARSANPQAVTLAEANETWVASLADAIYDQNLCHWIFRRLMDLPPDEAASALMRWLEIQKRTYPRGTVWLRYPESHDSYMAANVWGRAAADALMALCAWIDGIPLVYNEAEDQSFETWRNILRLREKVPELTQDASYLAVKAPKGVFACLRSGSSGKSVVLVNLNPERTVGEASCCGQKIPVDLPPYGYAIRRIEGDALSDLTDTVSQCYVHRRVCGSERNMVAELRMRDGGPVRAGCRIDREERDGAVRFRVSEWAGLDPTAVRLVVRFPGAEGWFAHTAEGDFQGPFVVRHASTTTADEWKDQYAFVRFDSGLHPFGLDLPHANVGVYVGKTAWRADRFGNGARVEVLDRVGSNLGLAVSLVGNDVKSFDLTLTMTDVAALQPIGPGTGDGRLKYIAGGWLWDDGCLRVRLRRNGAVTGVWRLHNGRWVSELDELQVFYRKNQGPSWIGWNGVDRAEWLQANDPYARMEISRSASGIVRIRTYDGRLRNSGKYHKMPDGLVEFRADYTFGPDQGVWSGELAFSTDSEFGPSAGNLGFRMKGRDSASLKGFASRVFVYGLPASEPVLGDASATWFWHKAGEGIFAPRTAKECCIRFGNNL